MKKLYLMLGLLASFSIFAGGGVGDGPINKFQVHDKDKSKVEILLDKDAEDCDRCDGVDSYHRMMEFMKKEDQKYLESLSKEIRKGLI